MKSSFQKEFFFKKKNCNEKEKKREKQNTKAKQAAERLHLFQRKRQETKYAMLIKRNERQQKVTLGSKQSRGIMRLNKCD